MPGNRTDRTDFGGELWQPEVVAYMLNTLLSGSPFANALSRYPTGRGAVAFPTAAPEAGDWVAEGAPIPKKQLSPDVDVVATCALKSLHSVTNESLDDTSFPLAQEIGRLLREADGPKIGFWSAGGRYEPDGVVPKAAAAGEAVDFRQACIRAWSELVAAQAPARIPRGCSLTPSPSVPSGRGSMMQASPIHDDQDAGRPLSLGPGIRVIPVPTLQPADVLACDVASVFFIERDALEMELAPTATTPGPPTRRACG